MVIKVMMMEVVDFGINRPATLPLSIVYQLLMVVVEVDIGLRLATIIPITVLFVVYCWVFLLLIFLFMKVFMVMR